VNPGGVVSLTTRDGVRLVADVWTAGNDGIARADRIGCVVAHGFTGSARNPHVRRICDRLVGHGLDMITPDFRGHGRSAGHGTAGLAEIHDVEVAVGWLRAAGYGFVAILGWSMGGTAVLRHAGLGGDADAVVSVSAPGTWFERGTRAMRVAHWMVETRSGRVATRVLRRTRMSVEGWDPTPPAPAEVIGGVAPRPLLVVHGGADHYFPMHHVESLAAGAPDAEVWIEPAMAHAETATDDGLVDRIADWVQLAAASRRAAVCDDDGRD
jgi:pimeloyl-ACP methyl ester carboxylesterase